MNRYSGVIGIRLPSVETSPGILDIVIQEIAVTGRIYRKPLRWSGSEASQDTVQLNQMISIVAPEIVQENLDGIVYATYQGRKWVVQTVSYERPRLELSLGGTYNA